MIGCYHSEVRRLLALSLVLVACAKAAADADSSQTPESNSDAGDAGTTDASAPADGPTADAASARPLPAVPFHTQSRWILDANDERFKLVSVNWYGAESKDFVVAGLDKAPLATIAAEIRRAGFNSVRLPWSNELVETDPVVAPARVSANPSLVGKHALEVFDTVIAALAFEGIVVVLDNHVSHAEWCCTEQDGNGLWFTPEYPESKWLDDWRTMAKRYRNVPAVIGAELRNELRGMPDGRKPNWGGTDATLDWRAAAKRGGDAVLEEHPSLLVMIDGLEYSTDLTGAYDKPLSLAVANRLVWAPHDYPWFHPGLSSTAQLKTALGQKWGFLLVQGQPYKHRSGSASSASRTPHPRSHPSGSRRSSTISTTRTRTGRTGRSTARSRPARRAPSAQRRRSASSTTRGRSLLSKRTSARCSRRCRGSRRPDRPRRREQSPCYIRLRASLGRGVSGDLVAVTGASSCAPSTSMPSSIGFCASAPRAHPRICT